MKKSTFVLLLALVGFSDYLFAQTSDKDNSGIENRTIPYCNCIPVTITNQPSSPAPICASSGTVQFSVSVSGTAPFIYQWRENGTIISDGLLYGGTQTATLTIHNPSYALNGKIYRCIISNCSGSAITNSNAVLTIKTLPGDINRDGITDVNDFFLINAQLNTSCPNCPEDINSDGMVDIKDFLLFLGDFNFSCL